MLQNAYFLAKIGADTAENQRNFAEILPKICNYPTGLLPEAAEPCARLLRQEALEDHAARRLTEPFDWAR